MAKIKIPLSVFIIAQNEEDRIGNAIDSVIDFADEVLVIDGGSKDNTASVASAHGARVIFNEWKGYGAQKNFGQNACRNDWILNLDADEEVDKELSLNIQKEFASGGPDLKKQVAFEINFITVQPFERSPHPLSRKQKFYRLYNRNHASAQNFLVHDMIEVKQGKTRALDGYILHHSFRSLEHQINKINYYSSMQAVFAKQQNRKSSRLKIIIAPIFGFIKAYFFRRYFLYGIDGFSYSIVYGFGRMMKAAKIRELEQFERRNDQ